MLVPKIFDPYRNYIPLRVHVYGTIIKYIETEDSLETQISELCNALLYTWKDYVYGYHIALTI